MAYKENSILTTGQLKKLSEHKYQCDNASLLDSSLQPWGDIWYRNPSTEFKYNCRSNSECCHNFDVSEIHTRRNSCSTAMDSSPSRFRSICLSKCGFNIGKNSQMNKYVFFFAWGGFRSWLRSHINYLDHYPNWLFFQCFYAIGLFDCRHWQAYVSSTLCFGKIDVTDAQLTIIGIHLISRVRQEFWLTT
uniref:Uncharacterized protein n=1 Tax=Glossina pallidipes TaxID=7398 RepID=A0A1A9Z4X4_GLOPL